MGLPFIKLQQHTLNHGGTKLLGIGGEGAGGTEEREGAGGTEGKRRDEGGIGERESVTCVMEATLLLGSTIFKERS